LSGGALFERGKYLERVEGDLPGAQSAYRLALARLHASDEIRAEVLFRYGALLFRRGDFEGAVDQLRELKNTHARFDLNVRADALLALWSRATVGARARIIVVDEGGALIVARVPPGVSVELGQRLRIERASNQYVGEALVLDRSASELGARVLPGAAVQVGDFLVLPSEGAETAGVGASPAEVVADATEELARARVLLAALREVDGEPVRAGATVLLVSVLRADPSLIESSPLVFVPLRSPSSPRESGSGGGAALVAEVAAEQLIALRSRLSAAPLTGPRGSRVYRTEVVSLEAGAEVPVRIGGLRPPGGEGQARFEGLLLGLHRSRGGGDSLVLDLDGRIQDLNATLFPGIAGPIAASKSAQQVFRGRVELSAESPAVLIGGLLDPFSNSAEPAELLLLIERR
jgi:hypothetical protein